MAILYAGIDLAKIVFAVRGVDAHGKLELVRPPVRRRAFMRGGVPPTARLRSRGQELQPVLRCDSLGVIRCLARGASCIQHRDFSDHGVEDASR